MTEKLAEKICPKILKVLRGGEVNEGRKKKFG